MQKVLLSKKEATALKNALERSRGDKSSVIQWHSHNLWDEKTAPLNDVDLDTVCKALYVGYEVEPGPEEKVLEIYNDLEVNGRAREIVKEVLKIFNIQIKGINC
ncbi:hypothetical protein [Neobacillus mesonae]|uniref:hypothetical protein n=1 Tax=Neobacillus mesonae TaxID=1193713 RepID=UPI002E1C3180|nr:hypothetical protein [Neobacillus mesonae]